MLNNISLRTGFVLLLLLVGVSEISAQRIGRVEQIENNTNGYYSFVLPGAQTVQIQVMGAVPSPGLYEVPSGTPLNQLLSLTGGPMMGPRARLTPRTVKIKVFRPAMSTPLIYETEFQQAISDPASWPVFQDGDVMEVEVIERQRIGWRDVVALINTAAIIIFTFDRISDGQ